MVVRENFPENKLCTTISSYLNLKLFAGTSSMLSAICYAWLLGTKMRNNKEGVEGDGSSVVVLPVINVRRGKMWKQRQAAWLFHHVGVNAKALLFSEEVTCSFIFVNIYLCYWSAMCIELQYNTVFMHVICLFLSMKFKMMLFWCDIFLNPELLYYGDYNKLLKCNNMWDGGS